ncbi:recombinase family protein [Rhodoblastus sp.]|jgi:DNA invertase Pin-like site-specific DNA recombinase|uniref:recombinase family protein n=1 Tax=Rhodoblastus sp. TaxID=1962975 RepID=UPI0025EFFCD7|nr:recombinase family protein [Rhodoblastus sp.]
MRAAIYARYSSDQQREASIEDQIRLCKERITKEGWTLVQVFRDSAMSGATTLRPGYQAMLEAVREAGFDVIVAEALDRLSRDQEDVAALFKRLQFAGIKLITLAEGEIGALHIGLKGTMNALFLKDLADKVRRGLRGRIEDGKSGGGNSYGYDVVRTFDAEGEPIRGERRIDPVEAEIIKEIFARYAAGASPRKIAMDLNARGVSAPRGGTWSGSTLNGNRARGTGVLNNEMYIGRLVWNRLRYAKDPETGRRRSRANEDEAVITTEAPELAIVSNEVWNAVKARQAALGKGRSRHGDGKGAAVDDAPAPFWSKQRPRYLFSGLMRCGVCGGGFSKISAAHFGCSTARNKGESVCANRLTIRRDVLEATVMDGLRHRLMDPALFKAFAQEFTAEWNRLQADAGASLAQPRAEHERVNRQIERLVDALAEGEPAARVTQKLRELERRRLDLEAELATATAPAPRLHPNLAEVYRRKVEDLQEALADQEAGTARELVRGLVEAIVLVPESGRLRVAVRGELGAILRLSGYPSGVARRRPASG